MVDLSRRKFNFETDYDMMKRWWEKHNLDALEPDFLSRNGIITRVNDTDAAMGFIYSTDSSFCFLAFVVCDPDLDYKDRGKAIDYLIDSAIEWSEKAGFKSIMCNSEYKRFTKRLLDKGFFIPVKKVDHLFFIKGQENGK